MYIQNDACVRERLRCITRFSFHPIDSMSVFFNSQTQRESNIRLQKYPSEFSSIWEVFHSPPSPLFAFLRCLYAHNPSFPFLQKDYCTVYMGAVALIEELSLFYSSLLSPLSSSPTSTTLLYSSLSSSPFHSASLLFQKGWVPIFCVFCTLVYYITDGARSMIWKSVNH